MSHLAGILINKNEAPEGGRFVEFGVDDLVQQEFALPADYERAPADIVTRPHLIGFQLLVEVQAGQEDDATLDWIFEFFNQKTNRYYILDSGTTTGVHTSGEQVWMDIYFNKPIPIPESLKVPSDQRKDYFRLSVRNVDGLVNKIWYNKKAAPLVGGIFAQAYKNASTIVDGGQSVSLLYRVLALTVNEGEDFLGNRYRKSVYTYPPDNLVTTDIDTVERYWLSKPNPSRFAVESLYFNQTETDGTGRVVDGIVVDPVTPGMYFHVYYTDEGDPQIAADDWDAKLWHRVPRTFHATKRDIYKFPEPVVAKYFKIEFSSLQPQPFQSVDLDLTVEYKKYPKWVLDYFALRVNAIQDTNFVSNIVSVTYDALDLAYNYYLDDIRQEPDQPVPIDPIFLNELKDFYTNRSDLSDQVDPATLAQIDITLNPWRNLPQYRTNLENILGQASRAVIDTDIDYPVERIPPGSLDYDFGDVSTGLRDPLIFEKTLPVMYFYLPSRHTYREVEAAFTHDRAYFAGVKEIAFLRDKFTVRHDTPLYIDTGGDFLNTERNDFTRQPDGFLTVY